MTKPTTTPGKARDFFHTFIFIFWDSKRPITADLLCKLNIEALAAEEGVLDSLPSPNPMEQYVATGLTTLESNLHFLADEVKRSIRSFGLQLFVFCFRVSGFAVDFEAWYNLKLNMDVAARPIFAARMPIGRFFPALSSSGAAATRTPPRRCPGPHAPLTPNRNILNFLT